MTRQCEKLRTLEACAALSRLEKFYRKKNTDPITTTVQNILDVSRNKGTDQTQVERGNTSQQSSTKIQTISSQQQSQVKPGQKKGQQVKLAQTSSVKDLNIQPITVQPNVDRVQSTSKLLKQNQEKLKLEVYNQFLRNGNYLQKIKNNEELKGFVQTLQKIKKKSRL